MKKISTNAWSTLGLFAAILLLASCYNQPSTGESGAAEEAIVDEEIETTQEQDDSDSKEKVMKVLLDPKTYPASGQHNIAIKYTGAKVTWFAKKIDEIKKDQRYRNKDGDIIKYDSVKKVIPIEDFDLKSKAVEIWFTDASNFNYMEVAQKPFDGQPNNKETIDIGIKFDAKLVPQGDGVSFIGGQDTRDVTGNAVEYFVTDVTYDKDNPKKIRVWYSAGNGLIVAGNKNTTVEKKSSNTCTDFDFTGWNNDFSYNPLSKLPCL